ncbi:MAG: septal ring lytic transglycosylase RlpA family protein [Phormidium sp. BM_Day4_Bin.17]|nr:septal ring lytic transglycosylase RlpA family protein [Phormidium sp. BM_Day4_Bin.17]UCJ13003.1 MAG: septal ring lytic transglycosylase RlpA family protein [Phormidium sp. PBR-2020]
MSYQLWRRFTVALAIAGVSSLANLANASEGSSARHLSRVAQATVSELVQGTDEAAETVTLSPTAEERYVANQGQIENANSGVENLSSVPSQILDNSSVLDALAPPQPEVLGTFASATHQAYRDAGTTNKPDPAPKSEAVLYEEQGIASWYGPGFEGNQTANGEIFNSQDITAAHLELPFGTHVRVTNLNNGRSLVVRINDRGPYIGNRIIDLSAGAARELGMIHSGTAPVVVEVLAN